MKEIKAYIRTAKLNDVMHSLRELPSVSGISVSKVDGFGIKAKQDILGSLQPYNKLEIVCSDEHVEELVALIKEHAHTVRPGDGKIFVYNVESATSIFDG